MNRCLASLPALLAGMAILVAACTPAAEPAPRSAGQASSSRAAAESEPGAGSRTPVAATETVQLTVSQFEPTELTIAIGTEVSFVNAAGFEHTVTEGTGGQPVENPIVDESVAAEGTITVSFDNAGTYELTCRIHPTMHLTITVEA